MQVRTLGGSLQKEEAAHKSTRVELSEARERAEASLKEVFTSAVVIPTVRLLWPYHNYYAPIRSKPTMALLELQLWPYQNYNGPIRAAESPRQPAERGSGAQVNARRALGGARARRGVPQRGSNFSYLITMALLESVISPLQWVIPAI